MSNELYGVLVKVLRKGVELCLKVLRKGVELCSYVITSLFEFCLYVITNSFYVAIGERLWDTPLLTASRLGHVSSVRRLLKYEKTVFGVEDFQKFLWTPNWFNKKTAFDVAVEGGHDEVAKLLLENSSLECLVSKRNHEGKLLVSMLNPEHDKFILDTFDKATNAAMHPPLTSITIHEEQAYESNFEGEETPAYVAAREGHLDILIAMIRYFRTKNDNIESSLFIRKDNHNALHIAIQNHHVGVVFWLIKEVPQLANLVNNFGESPIYLAAERRYYHILKHMLTKCKEKSFEGPKGKTALHAASISGSGECIQYLLAKIDQHIRDEQGWTPLQYDKDTSAIHIAASREEHGWTPFRYAVYHNNASAAAKLVDADPFIVNEMMKEDDINTFAVHIAASRGYWETLKVLMSHCPGCSELVDEKKKNILHVAVEKKQPEVIKLIYRDESYTSLVNQKDIDGNTPVHLLLMASDDFKMMDLVIDTRVNINVLNNEKLTPLEIASSYDKRKRLLEGIAMVRNEKNEKEKRDVSKLVENYSVLAALITTASFAAAFTVPGGFNGNEGSKQGMPILLRKAAFQAFMVTNAIAFSCSITVLFIHFDMLPKDGHEKDIHDVAVQMERFTAYAMIAMMVAFATGIYVVLTPYLGLAIFLCTLTIVLPVFGPGLLRSFVKRRQ